jgi:HK97 family phage portal protein
VILEHPGRLRPEAAAGIRESWEKIHAGPTNSHRTAVLDEGMKAHVLGMTSHDAEFLENRKFQVVEIARVFRVPPHMIGDLEKATFSNIEQQSIDFVVHTIRPWLVRWEQAIQRDLVADDENYFCEFNVDGLLRGDSISRGQYYNTMFNIGAFSINDIRAKENLNPVPDGDTHFVPLNMQALEFANQPPEPAAPPAGEKEPEQPKEKTDDGNDDQG